MSIRPSFIATRNRVNLLSIAPDVVPGRALLGATFQELEGPIPIEMTPRGEAARRDVLAKLGDGRYQLEDVPCPCGATDDRLIATVDRYRVPHSTVLCRRCALVRTNPRMDEASYVDFYTHHYRTIYERADHESESYYAMQVSRGRERNRFVFEHCRPPASAASVLEIGCGGGWNLLPFHEEGWRVMGWDFDDDYLAKGRTRGMELRHGSLAEAVADGRKHHVIILSHVLEHLLDPVSDLRRLRSILTLGGVLYIEVPSLFNVTGQLLRYFQNAHTYSFTPDTLRPLMLSAGYRPIAVSPVVESLWTAGPETPFPSKRQAGLVRRTENFLWRRQIDSRLYQRYRGFCQRASRLTSWLRRPIRFSLY